MCFLFLSLASIYARLPDLWWTLPPTCDVWLVGGFQQFWLSYFGSLVHLPLTTLVYLFIYFKGFSTFWLRGPHEVNLLNAFVALAILQLNDRTISLRGGSVILVKSRPYLLIYPCDARKLGGHVIWCYEFRYCLFLLFFHWILKLCFFVFSFLL